VELEKLEESWGFNGWAKREDLYRIVEQINPSLHHFRGESVGHAFFWESANLQSQTLKGRCHFLRSGSVNQCISGRFSAVLLLLYLAPGWCNALCVLESLGTAPPLRKNAISINLFIHAISSGFCAINGMDEVHGWSSLVCQRQTSTDFPFGHIRSAISAVESLSWVSAKCADETQNRERKGTAPSSLPVSSLDH
jgi:hypothetical protein